MRWKRGRQVYNHINVKVETKVSREDSQRLEAQANHGEEQVKGLGG